MWFWVEWLYRTPINGIAASLLLAAALGAIALSLRRFHRSYRRAGCYDSAVWFIRAIRWLLIALTAAAWAAGIFWGHSWLLISGLVILAQELYEGAVLGAALRQGARLEEGDQSFP